MRDGGPCFLRGARERAEQAHIVVVNHALLLSDLMHGGSLIPDYNHLIIDEAHNLEEEATSQLGFQVSTDRSGRSFGATGAAHHPDTSGPACGNTGLAGEAGR